jgi:P4 family phage/plasmid primase-like protien
MLELTKHLDRYIQNHDIHFNSDPVLSRVLVDSQVMGNENGQAVSSGGSLYVFDGSIWNRIKHDDLISLASDLDGVFIQSSPPKRLTISISRADAIARMCLFLSEIREEKYFDKTPLGVAAQNGFWTVDDYTVSMMEHGPQHRATWGYDFEIDSDARPDKFIRFLDSLWKGDPDKEDKKRLLQEWIGCCLIGKSPEYSRALLCVGGGGNGKSLLMKAVETLFPEERVTSASPKRWDHEYTAASLRDSSINIVSELPEYNALDSSDTFKSIVAGDRISGRLPYAPPFTFIPKCGHLFSANALPAIGSGDYSDGFFRRFAILEFNRSFTSEYALERRDPGEILAEVDEERPAIIYWALYGAVRLLRQGQYTLPDSHKKILEQWHIDSDPVKDFVTVCCTTGESSLSVLFSEFQDFCSETGRRSGSARTLAKRLRLSGFNSKHTRDGTVFNIQPRPKMEWLNAT